MAAALREIYDVGRARTATHRHLRDRIVAVALLSLVVDVVCAAIALALERHAAQTEIRTFGSAIFWTSTQLLTVSSSIKNPVSAAARVLDVVMELYAITVVATLAGSFGAFFHRRGRERDAEAALAAASGA
jgi:succinate dehydrogenase hydrophobic anchor subunit